MSIEDIRRRTAERRRGEQGKPAKIHIPPRAQPCGYARELTGKEREAAGKSHTKLWNLCQHPDLPLGEKIVCPCSGCGPGCRGYDAEAEPLRQVRPSVAALAAKKQAIREAPIAVKRKGKAAKYVYGVTTVPQRRGDLLPRTLASLKAAGFPEPRLFVDGDTDTDSWRREFGLEVVCRYPTIRTFGNWILGLAELYIRDPHADRYMMFQDDLVTYRNLRAYLDECPYPDKSYYNLYTVPKNEALAPSGHIGWYKSNQRGLGALALMFNRDSVVHLLTEQHHIVERPMDRNRGWRAVDGGVVDAMNRCGWAEHVHSPSLVQHTGVHSTMGTLDAPTPTGFRGESFDAMELADAKRIPSGRPSGESSVPGGDHA